mmetsp:Transcript_47219/g.142979  ORF Transcript_47219/g.142979 Transcript_47219/m.142979 type:complete len:94 (+) Transcript_47219:907-1188(+)
MPNKKQTVAPVSTSFPDTNLIDHRCASLAAVHWLDSTADIMRDKIITVAMLLPPITSVSCSVSDAFKGNKQIFSRFIGNNCVGSSHETTIGSD